MESYEQENAVHADVTPAVPLEISAELAARVDAILQDFAEGAELETALVVEMSGSLVSGISSEAEVMIDVISALVAGATGAMSALVRELGGGGNLESFHQSESRAVYLSEIKDRFVLVGVSVVPVPVGVIREKARQIRPALIDLLSDIKVATPAVEKKLPLAVPLRSSVASIVAAPEPVAAPLPDPIMREEPVDQVENIFFDDGETDSALDEFESPLVEPVAAIEEELEVPFEEPEPAGVIEYLEDESPEVVIESASGMVIDSPFEAEYDDDEDLEEEEVSDSIFELEDDEEALTVSEESAEPLVEEEPVSELPPIFEADEDGDENDEMGAFELDFDEFEEDEPVESAEGGSDETVLAEGDDEVSEAEPEEEEARTAGPFYF